MRFKHWELGKETLKIFWVGVSDHCQRGFEAQVDKVKTQFLYRSVYRPKQKRGVMQTFFHAFSEADPFGKLIFFTLFALSALSWFFLMYKIWNLHQVKKEAKRFTLLVKKQKEQLLKTDFQIRKPEISKPFHALFHTAQKKTVEILEKNHFFAQSNQTYLSSSDMEWLDSHLRSTIEKQRERLEKHLFILPTTITLAPFLGLLGTVWGILITFGELKAGHSVSSSTVMLGGLSTALTTTVLGLLIAIPSIIAFSYIKNLLRHLSTNMQEFSHFLISTIELQYRKVDIL